MYPYNCVASPQKILLQMFAQKSGMWKYFVLQRIVLLQQSRSTQLSRALIEYLKISVLGQQA